MPRGGFTLVELLIVIAILAAVSVATVVVLNPAELLRKSRDVVRLSDLKSINSAISLYSVDVPSAFFGTQQTLYLSLPDSSPTCASWSLPSLPGGWSYACSSGSNFRNVNGTGWIPIDFSVASFGAPFNALPIDPINTDTGGLYYTYVVGSWELTAKMESETYGVGGVRDAEGNDEGDNGLRFEVGTNLTLTPDIGDGSNSSSAPTVTLASPNSGTTAGGTSVTITGTNFVATPSVYFGGSPATGVVWNSATSLSAVTPAHAAGSVGVQVVNPDSSAGACSGCFVYTSGGNTTTIGNGADPVNSNRAPGGSSSVIDAFTFQTNAGTDTVSSVVVTLAAGTNVGISLIEVVNDGDTVVYGSSSNPGSATVTVDFGTPITAGTTVTQYKVKITPKAHISMPTPPGGSYAVTGTVTDWSGTNTKAGSDSGSATVTIDNLSPGNVSAAAGSAGDTQVTLSWTNPGDSDFANVLVLRRTGSAVADVPVEGASYSVGNTIGSSAVRFVGTSSPFIDTGLTNGTAYHYKIFTRDTSGNYSPASPGVVPTGSPFTPTVAAVTTLGSGSDPASVTVAPGSGIRDAGTFTFSTNVGTDSITALTVSLAGSGTPYSGLSEVRITSDGGGTTYLSPISNPTSNTLNFTSGTPITASTTETTFKIRVTPKSHAAMAAPPGASYTLTPSVSTWTGTNTHGGSDTNTNTLVIDNTSPGNASNASGTPTDSQVSLSWTNPGDADLSEVVVLRRASTTISDVPTEGASYSVGNTIGASTVACVVAVPTASCADTGLVNGTSYYYKLFTKDSRGNYATGLAAGPWIPSAGSSPPGIPGTPTFSSVSTTTLTLSWTAATDATSYKVERAKDSGGAPGVFYEIATGVSVTTYTDQRLPLEYGYWYRVRGTNAQGDGPSSGNASVTTKREAAVPGTPGTPTFSSVATSSLTVSWSAPAGGAASYALERGPSDTGPWTQVATTTAGSFHIQNTGEGGTANLTCSVGTITTYTSTYGANAGSACPAVAQSCTVGAASCSETFSNAVFGDCHSGVAKEGDLKVVCSLTAPSQNDSGLSQGTTYWYRVRGVNAEGPGSFSAAASVTTQPGTPTTQTRAPTSDEGVSGTWTGSAGSRYASVNDYPDSSGSTKLTHGTTAGYLTFGFSSLSIPAGASSISVQVQYYDQKTASQGATASSRLKVGGIYYDSSTHNPSNGTWVSREDNWATNPKTGVNWTANDINGIGANALQAFGFSSTDASPTVEFSSVRLQVTYTP